MSPQGLCAIEITAPEYPLGDPVGLYLLRLRCADHGWAPLQATLPETAAMFFAYGHPGFPFPEARVVEIHHLASGSLYVAQVECEGKTAVVRGVEFVGVQLRGQRKVRLHEAPSPPLSVVVMDVVR